MTVCFTSHAKEREHKTKTMTVTIMGTSLTSQAEAIVTGLCDIILYCYISSDGQRLMRTKPHRNIVAGDRTNKLPETMPLDFTLLEKHLNQSTPQTTPTPTTTQIPNLAPTKQQITNNQTTKQ